MVGKNQKPVEIDDEIEILEDRKTRKGVKQSKFKKPAKEQERPKNNDSELFADIDLAGVSEAEKEEIKRAILMSKEEEKQEQIQAGQSRDETRKEKRNSQENSSQQFIEEICVDDDATQPPDSTVQDDLATEDETDGGQETEMQEDLEETEQSSNQDIYNISTDVDIYDEGQKGSASPSLALQLSESQSPVIEKKNESTLQDEDIESDEDGRDTDHTQESIVNQRSCSRDSDRQEFEMMARQELQTSQRSQSSSNGFEVDDQTEKDQKNLSQGTASHQNSEENMIHAASEPLKRHYRNVRKQNVNPVKYFATAGMDPVQCTKVIMQLFDIYAKNLRSAQSKCKTRMQWGEPVKSGQHQSKTIDMKRRGQGSQYMILSDDEDEHGTATEKKERDVKADRQNSEENDLPDLVKRASRRLRRGESNNKDILNAETQEYDPYEFENLNTNQSVEDLDDKDFCPNAVVRMRNMFPKSEKAKENRVTADGDGKVSKNVDTKGTRSRLKRGNKAGKVLVEDTQKNVFELSSDEESKFERNETPLVVEETQAFDIKETERSKQLRSYNSLNRNLEKGTGQHANIGVKTTRNNNDASDILHPSKKENLYGQEKTAEIQPEAGHSRRRGRPKKTLTLVEDTQDLDAEITGIKTSTRATEHSDRERRWEQESGVRFIRGKRKSFQLKSDSEEESIPETQEMDMSQNVTAIEKKTVKKTKKDHKDNGHTGSVTSKIGSVFHKVKEYFARKETCDDERISIDGEEVNENSQSPVITKKRKLYTEPDSTCLKNFENRKDDNDVRYLDPTTQRRKQGIATEVDNYHKAEAEKPLRGGERNELDVRQGRAGVKKLFSRPPSKESNASDDISISNSQGSTTLLDEQGDLYSTQISEKPDSFRRAKKTQRHAEAFNIHSSTNQDKFDSIVEGNTENTLVVKSVKKDYGRKSDTKIPRGAVADSGKISQFFSKVPKTNEVVNVDTDSDDSEIQFSNHLVSAKSKIIKNTNQNSVSASTNNENPIPVKPRNSAKKFKVPNPDSENESSNDSHTNEQFSNLMQERLSDSQNRLLGGQVTKECVRLRSANENSPVITSQFVDQINAQVHSTEGFGGARPKGLRTRKVSETVTSGQLEEHENYLKSDETTLSSRHEHKGGRVDGAKDQGTESVRKKVVPVGRVSPATYPCPLCNQKFSEEIIEIHASECVGDIEEEEEHEAFAQAINTRQLRRPPLGHRAHGASLNHSHHDDHPENTVHHHGNCYHDSDLEEEEEVLHDIMHYTASQHPVQIEDSDVQDVAKDIKISPGEPGEVQLCLICDEMIPKGVVLEQHMTRCLQEAKQQQLEVDKQGFNRVFNRVNQTAQPDTPRTTRRQLRNQDSSNVNLVTIRMDPSGNVQREEGARRE